MSARETDRLGVIMSLLQKELTAKEAAEQLHLSVRQVKRLKKRVDKDGAAGLVHRGRGKKSNRKLKQDKMDTIVSLLSKTYVGFGPTLAAEKLFEREKITVSDETLRTIMIENNLWKPKSRKKNKEHRTWRPRRENYGSMEQYDGCYHKWFEERAPECCLLLSVDDATGQITKAWFDEHEGILPTFNFWKGYIEKNGKPASIYLDKFSTYKINHQAAQDNSELITQFQRACQDLGIELITAHSPEAKGRVEREFETLQDRLIKEMRLENISDITEANIFLEKKYIGVLNDLFSVVPSKKADLHRELTAVDTKQLDSIFSVHSERIVMNDFTIQFKKQFFQLEEQQPLTVCRKDTIRVEEHLNGSIQLKLRGKELKYFLLPKRPEKALQLKVTALSTSKPAYKPPANHPWRNYNFKNQFNVQTTRV